MHPEGETKFVLHRVLPWEGLQGDDSPSQTEEEIAGGGGPIESKLDKKGRTKH